MGTPQPLPEGAPERAQTPLITPKQFVTLYATDPLVLASGRTLGPITVAYEVAGRLAPAADNAVLVCHALTGDSHVAGRYTAADPKPGWWDEAVGPGRAIDTERYCVVCANVIGGCAGTTGPGSVNPASGQPYALDFPIVTPRDMARVHARLLDFLGVRRVLAAIGGSLGAMQAIEFAVTFPERTLGVIPIGGASRFHPQGIAWNEVQRQAILNDPHFAGGRYYGSPPPARGLATARMLGMITYRSDESMWSQFGREVRPVAASQQRDALWDDGYGGRPRSLDGDGTTGTPAAAGLSGRPGSAAAAVARADLERGFDTCYEVESYLHHNGEALVRRFDANSYLYLSRAMDLHDISRGFSSLADAYARVQAEALVVGIRSDILFPPYLQREQVAGIQAVGGRAEYVEMDSPWGHDAFLVDFHLLAADVSAFLARQHRRQVGTPPAVAGSRKVGAHG